MAKIQISTDVFNEAYLPLFEVNARYNVLYGGAGSGKSVFLADMLSIKLAQQKITLLVVMATYTGMHDKVFKELKNSIHKFGLEKMVSFKVSPLRITFKNGSEIIFQGADSEDKLLSLSGVDYLWAEEADGITYDYWTQLKLRLRGKGLKKRFFLSFNPVSAESWLKKEFFDNPPNDCFTLRTTYLDNKFLDDDYIDSLLELKERNPAKFRVYALGEWGILGKTVYDNWNELEFDYRDIVKQRNEIKAVFGLDFGYISDPSTMVCVLVDLKQRELFIFDELYEKGLLNNELAERIIEKGYAKESIIADSAEQKSIEEIRQYGVPRIKPARKGQGSIQHGIQFIQQFHIYVHPSCTQTINELKHYAYKKDKQTGSYTSQPIDSYNHILDALRYALEDFSKAQKNKITFLSKDIFGL